MRSGKSYRKEKPNMHIALQLDITRQAGPGEKPYVQSILYETDDEKESVASALRKINACAGSTGFQENSGSSYYAGLADSQGCGIEQYKDLQGNPVETIAWENSCLQKKCGACAMVIDGKPALACGTLLRDHVRHKGKKPMTIAPLSKFPVIRDLMVDRSILFDNLKTFGMWEEEDASVKSPVSGENFISEKSAEKVGCANGSIEEHVSAKESRDRIVRENDQNVPAFRKSALNEKKSPVAYEASRCLQCGCCLEVCPNFAPGDSFFGAAGFVPASRLLAAMPKEDKARIRKAYEEHEYKGCGKSLACMDICPAKIDIENLLVHSSAAVMFHR